ncbi:TPA: DUF3265 domain-containing protein [Vibrio vulnificus]|nr:DUF3265 domain-containing protein [Vibrio vulnificus]
MHTNFLRVICNAWHSYYTLHLVLRMVCSRFCIVLLAP